MIKLTVLYGHPVDPMAFESHYFNTHMPLVAELSSVLKTETTKFLMGPDGTNPPFYRMAELYFNNPKDLQNSLDSPEGKATTEDIQNFASGGVTILIGSGD